MAYAITLAIASAMFMKHALPLKFVLFGFVAVVVFFTYVSQLTMKWEHYPEHVFPRKVFTVAFFLRLIYVVFVYNFYLSETGAPFAYHAGDEMLYHYQAIIWHDDGFEEFRDSMHTYLELSDSGYCWWLALLYQLFGTHVLIGRVVKCVIDAFTCVLLYNLGKRNFGIAAGRITALMYMLIPNAWFYCGVSLKEIEMGFLVVLFAERADSALHSPKLRIQDFIIPLMAAGAMLTFRTAMAAVMAAALGAALVLGSQKQLQLWQKIVLISVFFVWLLSTIGVELLQESAELWQGRNENQTIGYQVRGEMDNGNTFAKYATASVFAPLIFTIPFSTMVEVFQQENQMMMNGANFIKNILSGFTIFALFLVLIKGNWRRHVLPIALMCGYLVVLVFSNFAHSERFHFPVLALELLFAAYGVTQVTNKHKRWYIIWVVGICVANITWAWIKLAGRGMA
jgi:hypothetical protein